MAMFVNKYKDTAFDLQFDDDNDFYVGEYETGWV